MSAPKLEWRTPELIVLVRGRPEEAVLAGCKTSKTGVGQFSGFDCTKRNSGRTCPTTTHS
jgi:hypothetical protein